MMDHNADIEKNIHEMKNFFNKLDSIIDSLPYAVSEPVKKLIKGKILGDKSLKTAMEFILSLCGTAGVGLTCRVIAQQLSKFLNIGFGAGSVISSTIAASGTMTIGKAAAAYYIERKPIEKIMSKSPFGKRSA